MSGNNVLSSQRDGSTYRTVLRAAVFSILITGTVVSAAFIGDTYCLKTAGAEAMEEYEVATGSIERLNVRVDSASSLTADDVDDGDTLEDFHRALEAVHAVMSREPVDTEDVWSHDEAAWCVSFNKSLNADLEDARSELETSLAAVEASHESHLLNVSLDKLKDSIADGQAVYDGTKGRVTDDSSRELLKSAIERGTYLVSGGTIDRDSLDTASESIDTASKVALDAKASWEAARSRASSTNAPRVPGHPASSDGGIWNVSYRGTDDPNYANSDGSVSEWKSGYYIAHDWSYGGGQIASKPGTVIVNGRSYRYVSSMVVSRDTTWSQVSGFVYANGGIGFQTCYGNGYLITHYEPV